MVYAILKNMPISTAGTEKLTERQTAVAVKTASPASIHMDALRGGAAAAVFLTHWRALFFADYPQIAHPNGAVKLLYALTGLGHSAVMIFFVLSGFLITSSINRALAQGRWSWGWYAEQRLTRLYVVLIPALILGAVWDTLGLHLFRNAPIYLAAPDYQFMLNFPLAQHLTAKNWFGCLFFLQGIRAGIFGSNGPLWSLSYEFWYYVIFPLGLLVFVRKSSLPVRLGCAAASLILLVFVGKTIALYFVVWLLGALLCACRPTRFAEHRVVGIGLGLLFALSLAAPRFKLLPSGLLSDFSVALTFFALLYFVLHFKHKAPGAAYTKAARALSNISYSLYLIHVPVLIFLNAFLLGQRARWQPTPQHLAEGILLAACVILYTYAIWSVTEARTGWVRAKILTLVPRRQAA